MEYTVCSFPKQSPVLRFLDLILLGRKYLPPCQTKSPRMLCFWKSSSLSTMTKYSSLDSLYRSNLLSLCYEGGEAKASVAGLVLSACNGADRPHLPPWLTGGLFLSVYAFSIIYPLHMSVDQITIFHEVHIGFQSALMTGF